MLEQRTKKRGLPHRGNDVPQRGRRPKGPQGLSDRYVPKGVVALRMYRLFCLKGGLPILFILPSGARTAKAFRETAKDKKAHTPQSGRQRGTKKPILEAQRGPFGANEKDMRVAHTAPKGAGEEISLWAPEGKIKRRSRHIQLKLFKVSISIKSPIGYGTYWSASPILEADSPITSFNIFYGKTNTQINNK